MFISDASLKGRFPGGVVSTITSCFVRSIASILIGSIIPSFACAIITGVIQSLVQQCSYGCELLWQSPLLVTIVGIGVGHLVSMLSGPVDVGDLLSHGCRWGVALGGAWFTPA